MTVRTRFAPSPTGLLHIGGIRTALFSWLYARHHGGEFLLRIEDTDRERSTEEAVNIILEGMQWLGLDHDEGPYYQTHRFDRYQQVIQLLLGESKAYTCYCSKEALETMRTEAMARGEKPKYNGKCRQGVESPPADIEPVIRFKNPLQGTVEVDDMIQGRVSYSNHELDDLIIARSDGTPTYNLTVVVDDMDMKISHVIRGDDHLNNTPRQINILNALGATPPAYAHVPMILAADGKKISKRDTSTVSVLQYREDGILPEALLNYLVRLGWSHGDQELFSEKAMVELFDIRNVNKAASALNPDKLLWLNSEYLRSGEPEVVAGLLKKHLEALKIDLSNGPNLEELSLVQRERCKNLVEMAEQSRYFFEDFDAFDEAAAKKHLRPVILAPMERLRDSLQGLSEWNNDVIQQTINNVADELEMKMGKIAQPLRVAVTGGSVSPSIDDTLRLMGKKRTLERMEKALNYIRNRADA